MKLLQILPILGALSAAPLHAEGWTSLGGQAVDVTSANGKVYIIQKDQSVAQYSNGQWVAYPGGAKAICIDTDPAGNPYIVSPDWSAHRGTGSGWAPLPGGGHSKIAVDGKNVVYATDGYHNLRKLTDQGWIGVTPSIVDIVGDPRGGLLFIDGGYKAQRMGTGSFAGSPYITDLAADNAGNPLVIDRDGRLHTWNGSGFTPSTGELSTRGLAVGSAGEIYVIGKDGVVYRWGAAGGGNGGGGNGGGNTGGGNTGGGNTGNRPPNAPTPLGPASTFEVPVYTDPGQRPASVRLSWSDNGDPDGDPIVFYIQIIRWDAASQSWYEIYKDYTPERNGFTFTPQHGLLDVGYYGWTVMAADTAMRSNPAATATPYQYFYATRVLE